MTDRTPCLQPISLRELADFRIGHWTDLDAGTGCTVIVAPEGAAAGVDVRGGAPASRETDLLRPENTVERIQAVCLSGGSAFGLEAASGVARELERRGIGVEVGPTKVPIVCSSCIFDLAFGDAFTRPGVDAGVAAARAALDGAPQAPNDPAGSSAANSPAPESTGNRAEEAAKTRPFASDDPDAQGNVGAGAGATVGKLNGADCAMKGGLGACALALGDLKVAALTAVNACGNVVDPVTHETIAGMRASADSPAVADMEEALLEAGSDAALPLDRTNTTISCIITNASLTKAQATKVAQIAADAYAHAIRPTHTTNDGDTVYVMASGKPGAPCPYSIDLIGLLATKALETAIASGVRHARTLHGIPGVADI